MTAAGYGAIGGAALGSITNLIGMSGANKSAINQIKAEGELLQTHTRMMNYNRELIDRQLGDVLSETALETAKNMATAKVLQSRSGTVGGTSALVSKQAYINQIQAEATAITQARNSEISVMMDNISKQISYRNKANSIRSTIKSPMEALVGGLSAAIGGASAGAQLGQGVEGAMGKSSALPTTATPTAYQPDLSTRLYQATLPSMKLQG